jgi:protein-disulfide isomerase
MAGNFRRALVALGLLGLTIALSFEAGAQSLSKEQGDAILQELKQIRLLLQQMQRQNIAANDKRAGPPANVKVSLGDHYTLGQQTAAATLVEFVDYQCPFCRKFHAETFEQLKKNYIDTGKLRYVSRDLPLPFHHNALKAAQAARCGGEQGKFWELRSALISNGDKLSPEAIMDHAKGLSLDMERFKQCIDSKKYLDEIQKDITEANAAGISGTPTFVLGKISDGNIEGVVIAGAQPYSAFEARIAELLRTN